MENRVYLRAFEPEDYKISIKWRNDDQIWSMLGGTKYFVSSVYEKKWIEDAIFNPKDIRVAICLNENDTYIGNAYITDIDSLNKTGVSHILIGDKSCWGQGYAVEALRLLLDYAFCERGLNRISAFILKSNIASIRMHEKVGYVAEGVMRQSTFKNGTFQDQVIMSILSKDFVEDSEK